MWVSYYMDEEANLSFFGIKSNRIGLVGMRRAPPFATAPPVA